MPITKDRIHQSSSQDGNGCWLWLKSVGRNGYGKFALGGGQTTGAHRASFQAFYGDVPAGLDVCHRCDVRLCVNPEHLFLGTRSENIRDAVAKNRVNRTRRARGERQPSAKLKDADIPEILRCISAGETQAAIARRFSVTARVIALIKRGDAWKHIPREV